MLPRCTGVAEVLDAHTPWEAAALFFRSGLATVGAILTESYVSLATLVFVFAVFLSMCRAGGIGAIPGETRGWGGAGHEGLVPGACCGVGHGDLLPGMLHSWAVGRDSPYWHASLHGTDHACAPPPLAAGVPPMLRRRPEFHGTSLAVRARVGGLATQLAYAGAHCVAHLTAAVSLLLLLELVGGDGWCLGADC